MKLEFKWRRTLALLWVAALLLTAYPFLFLMVWAGADDGRAEQQMFALLVGLLYPAILLIGAIAGFYRPDSSRLVLLPLGMYAVVGAWWVLVPYFF